MGNLTTAADVRPSAAPDERRARFEREALVHLDTMFRVALRFVHNADEAEDLVQEAMLKAYLAWDQYERDTNAKGWLLAILRRVFLDQHRRDVRRRELLGMYASEAVESDADRAIWDGLVDEEVARAIGALPAHVREVTMLRFVDGRRYEEIAAMIGVPVGTVKSRLFRGRKVLQRRLHGYVARVARRSPLS